MVSVPVVIINALAMLLLVSVMISCVEAVTIKGYPTSSRCRSGNIFQCANVAVTDCCDFVANNGAVQGALFENVGLSKWMATYGPHANTGCGDLMVKRRNTHGSPKSHRCLSGVGITGAKWHGTEPFLFATSSGSEPVNTTCERTVKAVLMTWNSTLREYTEVH